MLDETLAALAAVARHPAELRPAAISLLPDVPRSQAWTYALVEHSRDRLTWEITPHGTEILDVLAASVPPLEGPARVRAERALSALIAETAVSIGFGEETATDTTVRAAGSRLSAASRMSVRQVMRGRQLQRGHHSVTDQRALRLPRG